MPLSPARDGVYDTALDVVIPSAAFTATTSATFNTRGAVRGLVVEVRVTAVSGTTPSMTVTLEDTFDDGANWNLVSNVGSAITAAGTTILRLNAVATPTTNNLRVNCAITGTTPSFTFSVKVQQIRGS